MVITFQNHPREFLTGLEETYLAPGHYKMNYFKDAGIDHAVLLEFNQKIAQISHEEFFGYLLGRCKKLHMVLGQTFRFGALHKGDIKYLEGQTRKHKQFSFEVVSQIQHAGEEVSSRRIRSLLAGGAITRANQMLSRTYFIEASCIKGKQIGQKIGFPTINIHNKHMVKPQAGVYKSSIRIRDRTYTAMTFVRSSDQIIESHVKDFSAQTYGERITLSFERWIRAEKRFKTLESLRLQLEEDKAKIFEEEHFEGD